MRWNASVPASSSATGSTSCSDPAGARSETVISMWKFRFISSIFALPSVPKDPRFGDRNNAILADPGEFSACYGQFPPERAD